MKQLDVPEIMLNARSLAINGYNGLIINRKMFKKVFQSDYDNEMLKLLSSEGYTPDSGEVRTRW